MNICDAVLKSIPRVLTVVIFALIAAALTQPAQAQDYFYYTQPVSPCGYYPVGTSFSESCSSFGLSTLQEYYFDFTPSTTLDCPLIGYGAVSADAFALAVSAGAAINYYDVYGSVVAYGYPDGRYYAETVGFTTVGLNAQCYCV